jgi:hypothetical protein
MSEIETEAGGDAPTTMAARGPMAPPLLALFDDLYDEAGNNVGWDPVRWALRLPGGAGLTFNMASASSATLWLNLDDAIEADTSVSAVTPVDPRPYPQWKREQR